MRLLKFTAADLPAIVLLAAPDGLDGDTVPPFVTAWAADYLRDYAERVGQGAPAVTLAANVAVDDALGLEPGTVLVGMMREASG